MLSSTKRFSYASSQQSGASVWCICDIMRISERWETVHWHTDTREVLYRYRSHRLTETHTHTDRQTDCVT